MPKFFNLPNNIKRIVFNYFEDKPWGTKIKYGTNLSLISTDLPSKNQFKNSIIKLSQGIYIIGRGPKALVGKGSFGKVKYLRSIATKDQYVVKIIRFKGVQDQENINKELDVLKDLGLYHDAGFRKSEGGYKQYIVMFDAGVSLDKFLNKELGVATRFHLAIELCWTLHNLHYGNLSRTIKPYAHGDLKPANIAVKKGHIQLVDLGSATEAPDHIPLNLVGAPAYLPNLCTFLNIYLTARELDIFALKRVIYMPNRVLCLDGLCEDVAGQHFGVPMLFSEEILASSPCFSRYFDTGTTKPGQRIILKRNYHDTAMLLASVLILESLRLLNSFEHKLHIEEVSPIIVGLYFANREVSKKELAKLIKGSIKIYIRCKVLDKREPEAVKLDLLAHFINLGVNNNLKNALENNTFIHLVCTPSVPINKAACQLWRHEVFEERLLVQLKGNETFALEIIDLIFDNGINAARRKLNEVALTQSKSLPASFPEKKAIKRNQKSQIKNKKPFEVALCHSLFFSQKEEVFTEQLEGVGCIQKTQYMLKT